MEGVPGKHPAGSVGVGHAHAKAVLLGEHAVVYGAPALALPMPQLKVTARAGWSSHTAAADAGLSFTMTGSAPPAVVAQAAESVRQLVDAFRVRVGAHDGPHLDVSLDSAIPPGRGLGSSAANSRAIVLALADLFGRELTESAVFDLVQTAENRTHGRASGVDAATVGASAPLLFQAGRTAPLSIRGDHLFIIADSGAAGSTKEAVALLRAGFQRHAGAQERFVLHASQLVREAGQALTDGRPATAGARLSDYHSLLRTVGLSTDRMDALVEAALAAGSPGAKITGGGLGGCVLALSPPDRAEDVERNLRAAGAVRTWVVSAKEHRGHA
ncbi:mevalonate kinase [Streptomyces sp. NPDC052043]|uniref:mevalonate kinase n=1 Tax=Streptomyces sp. NPDC052043 TaxID=3365684 RepID=UPI0037D76D10